MKEAMWGLGLIMLCLLVFVIVGVVSNITLTNQQDYYGVKQTTEASAWDSIELAEYKSGVCLCTNKTSADGAVKFESKKEYALLPVDKETNTCQVDPVNYQNCELLLGEYILDKETFVESVIARLGSIIKPTEIYDITVQEVIAYPPKVSVNIEFKQALNIEGEDRIHQIIPNKFDGIFEETGPASILTYANNELPDWNLTCDKAVEQTTGNACYYDSSTYQYCWGTPTTCSGTLESGKSESDCVPACYCRDNGTDCGWYAKGKTWSGWKEVSDDKCNNPTTPTPTTGGGGNCSWHNRQSLVSCTKAGSCATKDYAKCGCSNIPDGTARTACQNACQICKTCSTGRWSNGKCELVETHYTTAKRGFSSCEAAKNDCIQQANALCPQGYTVSHSCNGWQRWEGTKNNANRSPFSFDKTCSYGRSCSDYSPYISCSCKG